MVIQIESEITVVIETLWIIKLKLGREGAEEIEEGLMKTEKVSCKMDVYCAVKISLYLDTTSGFRRICNRITVAGQDYVYGFCECFAP